MVKFKIGFTVEAETLFGLISRLMPSLQDLQVEEIYDQPVVAHQKPNLKQLAHSMAKANRFVDSIQPVVEKPITHIGRKKGQHIPFRHPSGKTLTDLVTEFLENRKGDVSWADMSKFAVSQGYEKSSINNAVSRLIERGIIERKETGVYGIKKK